jgi:hypothetical protein
LLPGPAIVERSQGKGLHKRARTHQEHLGCRDWSGGIVTKGHHFRDLRGSLKIVGRVKADRVKEALLEDKCANTGRCGVKGGSF